MSAGYPNSGPHACMTSCPASKFYHSVGPHFHFSLCYKVIQDATIQAMAKSNIVIPPVSQLFGHGDTKVIDITKL